MKTNNLTVNLTISEKQFDVLYKSLRLNVDLLLGNTRALDEHYQRLSNYHDIDYEKGRKHLDEVQSAYFPDLKPNSNYGIGNDITHEDAKITYEIFKI